MVSADYTMLHSFHFYVSIRSIKDWTTNGWNKTNAEQNCLWLNAWQLDQSHVVIVLLLLLLFYTIPRSYGPVFCARES